MMIVLDSKKKLDVYMNPQRQRLLREMRLVGEPVTPKQLSLRMEISPSSVQHHIGKLVELGVVELHHTANIRGITARYYICSDVTVSFGMAREDDVPLEEREIHIRQMLANVQDRFLEAHRYRRSKGELVEKGSLGDIQCGIIYLSVEEGKELMQKLRQFVKQRETKQPGEQAWEFSVVAYNAEEAEHDRER